MFKLRRIFKDFDEAGALNAHIGLYGFWDNWTVMTKAGDLGMVIRLEGIDYECLDHATRDYAVKRLESGLRLFDSNFRIYQTVCKQNRPAMAWPEHRRPVVQAGIENRRAWFETQAGRLYTLEIFWIIFYEGFRYKTGLAQAARQFLTAPGSGWRELRAQYSERGQKCLIRNQIEAAADNLRRQVKLFLQNVQDLTAAELLPAAKAYRVLYGFMNLDRERRDACHWRDSRYLDFQLADSEIECHRDYLRVGDLYARVLTLKQPPAATFPLILQKLLEIRANFHVVSEWKLEPISRTRKQIQSRRRHYHNSKTSILSQLNLNEQKYQPDLLVDDSKNALIAELGQALTAIELDGRQFGEYSLTLVVYDSDPNAAAQAEGELIKIFSAQDASLYSERYNLLNAFFAALPGNRQFNLRRFYLSDSNHADLSFLFTIHTGEPVNRHLQRECLAVVETLQATPYCLNLHDGDIAHTFMVGRTGAGKSFALNFLVESLQKYDPYTFIFDLGDGFRALAERHGGCQLEIGRRTIKSRELSINPFSLPPEPDHLQFIYAFVKLLIEVGGAGLVPADERELYPAIESIYTLASENRTLSSFARILPRQLAAWLEKWTCGGPYGFVFDHPTDNLTCARFQCFNFEGLDAYPDLIEPLLFYILHRANRTLAANSAATALKVFVMDEAWLFFRNPTVRAYIVEALKTWRKRNAALILATQSVDELRKSEILEVVVESCATKLFLANPDLDTELYRRVFHLNDTEMEAIAELIPKRQMLMKRPKLAKVLNLEVDPASYWLYTNDPFDNWKRRQAFERYGAEKGLEVLAKTGVH